ncbi:MAG: DNA primase [Alphaproteobacteria bacterium]
MSLSPRFLDEIRNRLTLSDIIGRRISVKRAGREFKACCPFHNEKSPSFTINDDKQFYHCFGCGAHGDVIGFVMQHDNLDFINAVEMLSADAGLQMPKPDPQAAKRAEKEKSLYDLMDEATKFFAAQLTNPANTDIQDYLDTRGLGGVTQESFRLGYAPADGQALRKHLSAQGFTDTMMIEAGVLKQSTKGGEPYIFFRDRVMFPVADRRGRIVAFGGRILPEHIRPNNNPNFTPPKYINSSDTPLFDKGRMLYGEQHARHAAREGHGIIVTEGYMDVIAAHQAGFKGAVAPMGTAMTEDQIANLWSMIPDEEKIPTLCFDGDNAGRKAAARACERILPLLQPDQSARFAFMPDGEDPDSLIRAQGAGALKSVLQAAMPLFEFIWATHTAGRTLQSPEQRAGLEKSLYTMIARIQDQNVQRYYKERIRNKISETFFPRRKAGGGSYTPKNPANALRLKKPASNAAAMLKEKILLAAILNHPALYTHLEEQIGALPAIHPRSELLRQSMIVALEDSLDIDSAALKLDLKNQGFEQEIDDICNESVYVHAVFSRPIPKGEEQEADIHAKAQDWLRLYESMKNQGLNREIRNGWKQAYENENEEEERKLQALMNSRAEQNAHHDD